jgi:hypothetical protein
MKKTTQLFLAMMAMTAIAFTSCGGGSNDPKTVVKNFFEKLSKKDVDGAAKYATASSKSTLDMMKKGLEMADKMPKESKEKDPSEEFKNMEFGEARISGDTAYVPVGKKGEKTSDIPLVKEDGKWKVDFSMGTLMKMGNDGKDDSMEDLDHLDSDSVKQEVNRLTDSITQNLDSVLPETKTPKQ